MHRVTSYHAQPAVSARGVSFVAMARLNVTLHLHSVKCYFPETCAPPPARDQIEPLTDGQLRRLGHQARAGSGRAPTETLPCTRLLGLAPAARVRLYRSISGKWGIEAVTKSASKPIRIVIVDDHTLFREGVRLILEPEPDLAVVGEAATVGEALPLIHGKRPDLVLLDLRLAQARGIDLLSQLVASSGVPRVLIVTAFPEEADIAEAVRLGATGVVLKDATRDTLLAAIRSVAGGDLWLPSELTVKVITALAQTAPSSLAERVGLLTTLESVIVSLVGQGIKNREIAERLGIAEKTIKGHLTNIFLKLGVQDRLELALLALKTHLAPTRRDPT
jgi:DNA-binding NarL/FixJ family response regulator